MSGDARDFLHVLELRIMGSVIKQCSNRPGSTSIPQKISELYPRRFIQESIERFDCLEAINIGPQRNDFLAGFVGPHSR
jgi:hypothetical protein